MSVDKTCLSYWFPKIQEAGLPVPRTKILRMTEDEQRAWFPAFDGDDIGAAAKEFADRVGNVADGIGYPCFLRTGHTSAKHSWNKSCYLRSRDRVIHHMYSIIEYSEMAGIIGMPWVVWAIREYLPIKPLGICPYYRDMPVGREFRFFVDGSVVICWHPYWPLEALERGGAVDSVNHEELCHINKPDLNRLYSMASAAGGAVGGAWSVDMIETERGWYLTDMAEAHKSFHWEGCEHDRKIRKGVGGEDE